MAQDLLVSDQLTEDMITAGEHVVGELDRLNVLVKAAFWLLLPDQHIWRLVIASPEVRTFGPKAVYRKVTAALKRLPPSVQSISTKDITVVEDNNQLIQLLKILIKTGPTISKIRLSRNVVNGQLIEDALLYRMT
jgi:hypothetical protein